MEVARSNGISVVAVGVLLATFGGPLCFANDYIPLGPVETESLEIALYQRSPNYTLGIWPRQDMLATGVRPGEHYITELAVWLERLLADAAKPTGVRYGSDRWVLVPEMRWNCDVILGRFTSRHKQMHGDVEFQATPMQVTLSFRSPELFSPDGADDARVREMVCRVLRIPGEYIDELRVEQQLARLGNGGARLCFGNVLWNWDPAASWPADKNREWWSRIPFWIADGKLCVSVTTFDWKQDDRPQVARNRFREITEPNPKAMHLPR